MTTTTLVIMRDAAWPSAVEPATAAELVYAGGDTPNPEIVDTSTARYRVPCWVRSNPDMVNVAADADAFVAWLHANRVPTGVVTILDLETVEAPAFVNEFGAVLHAAGYLVWPYGSTSTLFNNPRLDGYFAADPTGVEHLYPGTVATQWGYFGGYDLSVVAPGAALWDTQAPPPPPEVLMPLPESALPTSDMSAVVRGGTVMDIFVIGHDGHPYHLVWNGTAWQSWEDLSKVG